MWLIQSQPAVTFRPAPTSAPTAATGLRSVRRRTCRPAPSVGTAATTPSPAATASTTRTRARKRGRKAAASTGTLHVVDSKTAKGVREVHVTPALREELALWRHASRHTGSSDFVICTSTENKHNPSNLRRDVLAPAVKAANVKLEEFGIAPIRASHVPLAPAHVREPPVRVR
jgi:hypothetical protein